MTVEIKPLRDRVLVQSMPVETRTPAGIVMTYVSTGFREGRVLAVGDAEDGKSLPHVGDRVVFSFVHCAEVLGDDGAALLLVDGDDIYAVVRGRD